MSTSKLFAAIAATVLAGSATAVLAQAGEQFVPLLSYRVGPYASGGSGIFGGYIDYMNYINMKEGGVNGVKLVWEECETEYNNARGVECYERLKKKGATGASMVMPLSTGITYGLMDKVGPDQVPMVTIGYGRGDSADGRVFKWIFPAITTYWSQASGMIKYLGQKEGGLDKLKGKKIVHLYHDSAYGKEPISVLEELSRKYGFELMKIAVPHPGNEQQAQWLQIRQARPDYVILWGWGVMNPTALKAAAKTGFPREKMIGVWWAGSEEDVVPAGDAAKGYTATVFNVAGASLPLVQDIKSVVYSKGKGNMEDQARVGSVYHVRGIVHGIITVEAIRKAQEKFGKKPLTGDQLRWGLENLDLSEARLKAIKASGLMPPLKMSCADHEGSGLIKLQTWDGSQWKIVSDWIAPEKDLIRKMVEDSAAKYAKEKNLTPRDCAKEG